MGKIIKKIGNRVFRGYGDRASMKAWDDSKRAIR